MFECSELGIRGAAVIDCQRNEKKGSCPLGQLPSYFGAVLFY